QKNHHRETGDHDDRARPAEQLRALAFFGGNRCSIDHDLTEDESGGESARMGEVIDSWKQKTKDRDVDKPADDLAAQHLHAGASPSRCNRKQHTDQAQQRARPAHTDFPDATAEDISTNSSNDVDEKIARRAVELFNLRPDVHQHPHVEDDMHHATMKKNSGHETPRLC